MSPFAIFLACILPFVVATRLDVSIRDVYDFDVLINNQVWFSQDVSSGISNIFVTKDHSTLSTQDHSLSLQNVSVRREIGEDILGMFDLFAMDWQPEEAGFETSVRVYQDEPIIVFTQHFQVRIFNYPFVIFFLLMIFISVRLQELVRIQNFLQIEISL